MVAKVQVNRPELVMQRAHTGFLRHRTVCLSGNLQIGGIHIGMSLSPSQRFALQRRMHTSPVNQPPFLWMREEDYG